MTGWIPVKLHRNAGPDSKLPTIIIGPALAESLGVVAGRMHMAAGCETVSGGLRILGGVGSGTIYASPTLLSRLRLPSGIDCLIGVGKRGELRLGPVVAILADTRKGSWPFGEQNTFLAEVLNSAGSQGSYAFVIAPASALSRNPRGFVYTGRGWSIRNVPRPDVCYDRCLALTHSEQSQLSRAKARLISDGTIIFNTPVGSKEKVHNELKDEDLLREHIPETHVATRSSIAFMLRRHGTIYIKPSWGTQGKNIIKVARSKGTYSISSIKSDHIRRAKVKTIDGAISRISLPSNRRMLVQQGINLLSIGDRIADIRVLVQKGADGEWAITGCAARLGQSGSPVSNLHQGGGVLGCRELFREAFKSTVTAEEVEREVLDLSLTVARTLEKYCKNLGELGIDIGVDKSGRAWFIEANPRPGRSVFKHLKVPGIRRKSISRPMEYAKFLTITKHTRKEQQNVEGTYGPDREGYPD